MTRLAALSWRKPCRLTQLLKAVKQEHCPDDRGWHELGLALHASARALREHGAPADLSSRRQSGLPTITRKAVDDCLDAVDAILDAVEFHLYNRSFQRSQHPDPSGVERLMRVLEGRLP